MAGDVLLRDGTIAHVRDVDVNDRDALIALHEGLSDRGRYLRFFHLGRTDASRFVDDLMSALTAGEAVAEVAIVEDRAVALASGLGVRDSEAELAVVVADRYTGRGLETLVLEHLALAARRAGVSTFVAHVLAQDASAFDVLRHSGFVLASTPHRETVEVRIPVWPIEGVIAAATAREMSADASSVRALLRPQSVAVVGASRRENHPGHLVVQNLLQAGFTGSIYPVNPHCETVLGLACASSVREIAEVVDLAVIAVPTVEVLGVVRECARSGVRDLVILADGFAESGPEGARLQDEVLAAARSANMRLVGPNCLGIANTDPDVRLDATFSATPLHRGRIAMMAQSGAVGIAALRRAADLGVGLSCFISAGNKADVSGNDLLMYAAEDDATEVVALCLESFGNPRKFSRVARLLSRRKPIVALIGGSGGAAAFDVEVDALFRQCGVIRAEGLEQLLQTSSVLANQPLPLGGRVGIVSNAGGPAVLAADACLVEGLRPATLSESLLARIREIVPGAPSVQNPVDLGSAVTSEAYAEVLAALGHSGEVDMLIALHTPLPALSDAGFERAVRTGCRGLDSTGQGQQVPVATVAVMLGRIGATRPVSAGRHRVPMFWFPEDAARALAPIARHAEWRARPPGRPGSVDGTDRAAARAVVRQVLAGSPISRRLSPAEVGRLLGAYGIEVVPGAQVDGVDDAVKAAGRLGYPVALKLADPDIVHRTDLGGVRLDITDPDRARAAARELLEISTERPGLLVQRQVRPGPELVVGVTQDQVFGPLVMCGYGGVATELIGDRSYRLAPLSDTDAASALRELRTAPLLFGHRGAPAADVAAVENLLLSIGRLADDLPQVAEVELDPVIVHERGLSIVDAKVLITPGHQSIG
ncbi:Acyl-CoA synthetase (NDP forming) [Nocardioides sp. YR527]|uniref:bifunctional acetate--CoA ligase family protein/GNAT family N-acetyltransferase n=1 Tax=Nocardioides sp. YR527 TaxID=1881028 RepID=UPI000890375C|nr:acetate--CoA ligase [Nocardioides sp. YR527]SDK54085.1 Acyl-CoA synthetase (NDP forming) [Nocardioides sp. YR527]